MIYSIEFSEGGYITEKGEEIMFLEQGREKIERFKETNPSLAEKLSKNGLIRRCSLEEGIDYKFKKTKYANPHLVKNLLHRKIDFLPSKINVIFGPNACGKTTILRALSAYCGCGTAQNNDGWTNAFFITPHVSFADLMSNVWNRAYKEGGKQISKSEMVEKAIREQMKNEAVVDWDGVPVYADNFANRRATAFGEMVGSVIEDGVSEMMYHFSKGRMSQGQHSIFLLNSISSMMTKEVSLQDCISKVGTNMNDEWLSMFEANKERLQRLYASHEHISDKNTFLFDEIDKSMDIANVALLYNEVLPNIVKKYGVQIIIISHSPLILTDNIFKNELYNIISIDEGYTKNCRKMLKHFNF